LSFRHASCAARHPLSGLGCGATADQGSGQLVRNYLIAAISGLPGAARIQRGKAVSRDLDNEDGAL
jgi:hypothetical protein